MAAGQPLIVVEAMKMELAVTAPHAGIVKRISCRQGRPVGPGRRPAVAGKTSERRGEDANHQRRAQGRGRRGWRSAFICSSRPTSSSFACCRAIASAKAAWRSAWRPAARRCVRRCFDSS
ncbi:acetyl-CoA carboxylase biotin carboxyl carrier protein subunit [Serratia ureilytica]